MTSQTHHKTNSKAGLYVPSGNFRISHNISSPITGWGQTPEKMPGDSIREASQEVSNADYPVSKISNKNSQNISVLKPTKWTQGDILEEKPIQSSKVMKLPKRIMVPNMKKVVPPITTRENTVNHFKHMSELITPSSFTNRSPQTIPTVQETLIQKKKELAKPNTKSMGGFEMPSPMNNLENSSMENAKYHLRLPSTTKDLMRFKIINEPSSAAGMDFQELQGLQPTFKPKHVPIRMKKLKPLTKAPLTYRISEPITEITEELRTSANLNAILSYRDPLIDHVVQTTNAHANYSIEKLLLEKKDIPNVRRFYKAATVKGQNYSRKTFLGLSVLQDVPEKILSKVSGGFDNPLVQASENVPDTMDSALKSQVIKEYLNKISKKRIFSVKDSSTLIISNNVGHTRAETKTRITHNFTNNSSVKPVILNIQPEQSELSLDYSQKSPEHQEPAVQEQKKTQQSKFMKKLEIPNRNISDKSPMNGWDLKNPSNKTSIIML